MKSEFELAYYLYLTDCSYRDRMINCGILALCNDMNSANATLLAASDHADTEELLAHFRETAADVGLDLPSAQDEHDWIARRSAEYVAQGVVSLPSEKEFSHNIRHILGCRVQIRGEYPSSDYTSASLLIQQPPSIRITHGLKLLQCGLVR